jgi:hypothetical protein
MRRIVLLSLLAVSVHSASAQHHGAAAAHVFARARFAPHSRFTSPYGYAALPYNSDSVYADSHPPQPASAQLQPAVLEPPPPPVHPIVTNYAWPAPAASVAAEDSPQSFAIVLKDGSTRSAVTVVATADSLAITDPDERHLRIALTQIDRDATLRLNRQRNLSLHLPAPQ